MTDNCVEVPSRKCLICIEMWQFELESCVWRVSFHKYAYVHGDPIQGIDPTGMFFSVGGVLSGMSLGSSLNGLAGYAAKTAGQSALETIFEGIIASAISATFDIPNEFDADRAFTTNFVSNFATFGMSGYRNVKLLLEYVVRTSMDIAYGESIAWAMSINLLTLGTPALAVMGSKLAKKLSKQVPPGVFSGYAGGIEYIVKNADIMMKTKSEWTDFYLKFKPRNAKVIFTEIPLDPVSHTKGNAMIDSLTGNIYIDRSFAEKYPNLLDGAIMEELFHFKQFVRDGVLGTDVRAIPGYINRIEGEAARELPKFGLGVKR